MHNLVLSPIDPELLISSISDRISRNILNEILQDKYQHEHDIWFNVDELRRYHPDKPSKQTVYLWVRENLIPFHKSGKKLRFLKSEIDAWLRKDGRKTLDQLAHEADQYLTKRKGGKL